MSLLLGDRNTRVLLQLFGGTLLSYHSRAADEKDIYAVCNQVLAFSSYKLPTSGVKAMPFFFLNLYKF
jgi:hypothetical protein